MDIHHLQLALSVKTPPMRGPVIDPIIETEKIKLINIGLFSSGATEDKIVRPPFIKPAAPIPETARPTIKLFELGDTAQSSEPSSKMPRKERNIF